MAKNPYADDIARLSTAKRTHFTHFQVGKLPWHGEEHVFGESSDGPESVGHNTDADPEPLGEPGVDEDIDNAALTARRSVHYSTVFFVDTGKCKYCRDNATYGFKGSLYCTRCWLETTEEREDLYGGGA